MLGQIVILKILLKEKSYTMSKMKKLLFILLCLPLFFYSCQTKTDPVDELFVVDRKDEKSTAKAILKAYAKKDINSLSELSHLGNKKIFSEMIEEGEKHSRYNSIWGERYEAVKMWDGKTLEVVESNNDRSRVRFNKRKVVTLHFEDGKWCFEDIHNY